MKEMSPCSGGVHRCCVCVWGLLLVLIEVKRRVMTLVKEGFCDEVSALELARLPCMYGDKAVPCNVSLGCPSEQLCKAKFDCRRFARYKEWKTRFAGDDSRHFYT